MVRYSFDKAYTGNSIFKRVPGLLSAAVQRKTSSTTDWRDEVKTRGRRRLVVCVGLRRALAPSTKPRDERLTFHRGPVMDLISSSTDRESPGKRRQERTLNHGHKGQRGWGEGRVLDAGVWSSLMREQRHM